MNATPQVIDSRFGLMARRLRHVENLFQLMWQSADTSLGNLIKDGIAAFESEIRPDRLTRHASDLAVLSLVAGPKSATASCVARSISLSLMARHTAISQSGTHYSKLVDDCLDEAEKEFDAARKSGRLPRLN